ncbi:MAG TPA: shikimate kinase, partial [Pseudomonadales bacterium]|nr:shikimate kinase [Pseudomonadales bacterium]
MSACDGSVQPAVISSAPCSSNLYLVGPMGVGKTTVGRALAESLHLKFVDVDSEIERRAGANIPWIFDV